MVAFGYSCVRSGTQVSLSEAMPEAFGGTRWDAPCP